ncbi:MAG: GAF domain-containing protein [Campylobacterota bacterium]|nr:GAF domain-containing protein [Campylobacterota bacterium]
MDNQNIVASLKNDISKVDSLKESIAIVAKYAKKITSADRCSFFLYRKEKDQLRSVYADGIKGTIALRSNAGIVGYAFHKRESVLENDTSLSSIFLKAVDQKSGYKTKSILAVPIINSKNTRLGVVQLLNKDGGFSQTDKKNIEILAKIAVTILNPQDHKTQGVDPVEKREEKTLEVLHERFDNYLRDKKLFIMEDGSVYYKILNMQRDHFIGADQCYMLEDTPKETEIYHYTSSDEFLSLYMFVKIDEKGDALLISNRIGEQNFARYPLEKD